MLKLRVSKVKYIEKAFMTTPTIAIIAIVVWATIEEIVKFIAAYFGGLSKKANDEAVDVMIYLITAALVSNCVHSGK